MRNPSRLCLFGLVGAACLLCAGNALSWLEPKKAEQNDPIEGSYRLEVKDGKQAVVFILTLTDKGKGQLSIFKPAPGKDDQGSLVVAGLAYEVKGNGKKRSLALKNCSCIKGKEAIPFAIVKNALKLEGGKAVESQEDKTSLSLEGSWKRLPIDGNPFGNIQAEEGSSLKIGNLKFSK